MTSALFIQNARVLTLSGGSGSRCGPAMADLGAIDRSGVLIEGARVARVGPGLAPLPGVRVIDAGGRVLMPSFVDAHTHACFAGGRYAEWEAKLAGVGYLDLLAKGGGIMSTVRSVRRASEAELADLLLQRLGRMLGLGTTAVEVKSGYGLDTGNELKMLRAIGMAADAWPGRVSPTACIAHAFDADSELDRDAQVGRVIGETLPAVSAEFPGITIDAYCENGAWSLADCLRLFDAAQERGHPVRVHADQFNALGMIPAAIERGYRSVDHLEASTAEGLAALAASTAFGVVLPCSGFHLDDRYANARTLIDAGGAVVLATNLNPGSAPCPSMAMAIALGVRKCGLTPAEAITASTANASALLGFDDLGRIEPGCAADLILLRHTDERALAHDFGDSPVEVVLCGGEVVWGRC